MKPTNKSNRARKSRIFGPPLVGLLILNLLGTVLSAQSTNIAIGNTAIQPSVKKMGINLGTLNNYDSGQLMKNLVLGNPGFEAQIYNSTIRCQSGTPYSCTDENIYSGWPAHFWDGATYEFFFGSSIAGRTGTVVSSSAGGNGQGVVLNFGDGGVTPQQGDYLIVRKTVPGGASGGWFTRIYGAGSVSDNLTDLPPNTLGKQTALLTANSSSDSATITTVFDATNTQSFVQLNGTYQVQFKAKGLGGSNLIGVNLARGNGTTYINQSVQLTNSWDTYTLTFSASETGSAVGTVALAFSTVYGPDSFELDDVSLIQTNSDPANTSAFSDAVVKTLRVLQPGIIRYWGANGHLGETLDNLLIPEFGRQRVLYSSYANEQDQIDYGLHDFMVLCQLLGAEPWFVVPSTFTPTDASNLIEYLAGAANTTYGAKRAALGQTAPWTQVFPTIHLEFGNEEWNSTFTGGSILYAEPYGKRAQTIFTAMRANPAYIALASPNIDFVLGGQAASPGYNLGVQNFCNTNTSFTIAPYTMQKVDSYSDNESLFGPTFAEPEALVSSATTTTAEGISPGEVYQNYQSIQQNSNHPVPLSFYEANMSTLEGAISQDALNSYVSSLGAGLMVADTMLQGLKQFGVINQNLFALPQYSFTRSDGKDTLLWGAVIDMGVTDRKRPQFLALQLANQALSSGAQMLQTVHSGADPTWDQALVNYVQITGAHYLQSYAFKQGTSFSIIVFNLSRTSTGALPVTFSGLNAPAGTVQMQQLTATNLTDTNEASNLVNITSSLLTSFNPATGLTLPPYSMTVLTWSTSTQAPVISSVSATGITQTSAVINWTTDQASSSKVNYGTSASYGQSSPASSTLGTSHSVALTGLTPGVTYNYDVVSTNSASPGLTATSNNFTFTTQRPAPVISSVIVSGITPTSVTVNWTTDQPSTSQVAFGTTTAYGQLVVNSSLVTSHSVTITGLLSSTTYNIAVTSANASGTPASSGNSTFSTLNAPVISSVAVTSITSTSAVINWTTDQPATSQVVYGPSASYGASSAPNAALTTAHSVTLTGLTTNTTYNFEIISTNSYSLSTTSANSTFLTSTQGPAISYVAASAISNASATITWTTDLPSTSKVIYGTSTTYGSSSAVNNSLVTAHSVVLTGLTLGTTYNYEVVSSSAANASSTSTNFLFSTSGGATATNIAISNTSLQSSLKRMGITLGTLNNADSGLITKNLITANPGFEGQLWNSLIHCVAVSSTSCTDDNGYANWPVGFWNGATFRNITSGATGSVAYSLAPGSGQGITVSFSSGAAPAVGDYLILHKTVSGGSAGGWFSYTTGGGTVTDNLTDLPPGTQGQQTVELIAPAATDAANISTVFDSPGGNSFIQLNGTYQLQFKAKGLAGSNQIGINLIRTAGNTYINQSINLSTSWKTYTLNFSAAETGSAMGRVTLAFSTAYGADAFALDDVSLTRTDGDSTNPTVFRDSVLTALRTLKPGILRYWGGNGQLGESLDNLLTPQFGRQRAGYSEYSSEADQIDYGLHEFLALAQAVGAEPWFVVPSTFSTTDATNLIEYLAGASTTTYGAKRAALGQTAPWTQVFPTIHLEFGEQAWNPAYSGGSITNPSAYGQRAQVIFSAMKSNTNFISGNFDLVLGGQASSPADIATIQSICSINNSFDVEPYTMNAVDSYSDTESLYGSTFAEPEALVSSSTLTQAEGVSGGMIYQDYQAVQSARAVPLSFSEINLSTFSGAITQQALNSYVSSLGAGLMVADTMLQSLKQFGVVNQNLYSLAGYKFTFQKSQASYTADLFGSVIDMGVTDRRRPQYLALQLVNQALSSGATLLQTLHTGANPTWDQPLTNSVYLNGAHDLQSFAFSNGTSFSTVVFNFSRTATLPVTFSGVNAPSGTVQMQQLTSANPGDTNETANVVNITASTLTAFNGATGLSLPPYSMTVLTWSTSTGAPVISNVLASKVTDTSATITWQTDQPSASQVQYGTSSSGNASLVTNHSVTLTGLTAGTTYNYTVTSGSSTSSSSSFSTRAPAPAINSVSVTGITATAATITWTTDQAASSQVFYGTTAAYGVGTLDSTLTTSHSITLTGLIANTTYNFDVTSANAAGTPATSANATFSTAKPATITNVTATSITDTSAVITWTTDQSSSSQVQYGPALPYNLASTQNLTAVTSHSVSITGLTAGTTYNYAALSVNSFGLSATSANFTFKTTGGAPGITAIAVSNIASTSATITWTTDQATTSQVNYGITLPYGSNSTLNSSLQLSHSVTLTGLTPGATYNFDVVSANSAGVPATSSNSTFVTLALAPMITNVVATAITSTSATITWTTDQATSSQVKYGAALPYGSSSALDTTLLTSHSVTLTGLTSSTTYNFDVVSVNSTGAPATSSNFTFNTPAGTPTISNVVITGIMATSATITWTTDQATTSLVKYGTTNTYGSSSSADSTLTLNHAVTLTGLAAGTTYNFQVVSANLAGLPGMSTNTTFTTLLGSSSITNVVATVLSPTSVTITWATDQQSSSQVNYGLTAAYGSASPVDSNLVASHSVTLTGLIPNTTYNFFVVSVNSGGTSSISANASFTTFAGNPVVSAVTVTALTSTSATITWITDQATTSQVNYGLDSSYGTLSPLNSTLATNHMVTLTGLSPNTTYSFDVVSKNANGSSSTSANATFTTLIANAVVTNVTATNITSTSATITWTTTQAASSLVNYGPTSGYGSASQLDTTLVTSHSVVLIGLSPSTTYNFDVVSVTGSGASFTSANTTFITLAPTPVISVISVTGVTNTSATISWTTDQPASSMVNYGTASTYGSSSPLNSNLQTTHSITLTGLTAGTAYNFDVVSANGNGTVATSTNGTFTTSLPAPVITNVIVTGITATSATINWTTDQPTSTQVSYGTTTNYGSLSTLNTTLATSHSVMLTGLTASTSYNFDVMSANSAGTLATSPNSTFTTIAGTPVISNVSASAVTSTSATITWSTDQPTSSQVSYGTTTNYGSLSTLNTTLATSHSVTLTGLTASTSYNFDVMSVNSAGTLATSPNSTFTTIAGTPVISNVSASAVTSTSATITWTTDQPTSSQVSYGTTTNYGSLSTLNTTLATSHSVTLTGLTASTSYNFDVMSANSAGTLATSPNSTFTTIAGTPVITNVSASAITSTSAIITWTTDQATSSLVNYGTTTNYGSASTLNNTLVTSHSVTLTGLTPSTTYNFDVVSINSAGGSKTSSNASFATTAVPATIGGITVTAITATSATVSWTTDLPATSLVNYGTSAAYGSSSALNSSLVTTHSVTLSGLTASTTYNFDVVSTNASAVPATSSNSTFTTPSASATPPQVGYVAFWGVSNSGVYISWSTDVLANGQLAYGTTTALGQLTPLDTTMSASHGVVLTGLNSGTKYYFVAQGTAANGATGYSTVYTFTTTGTASNPGPVITNVTAFSITNTSATITWTTDQASSSQVNYGTTTSYGSASTLNSSLVTNHSVTLNGLTAGTTYNFDVVSANSGAASTTSSNATFTTTGNAPPVITSVTATSISNTSATITWTTDQASTSAVTYGATPSYGATSGVNNSLVTSHSVTLTGLTANTTYNFAVVSANAGGISTTSPNATFTTTATVVVAPVITSVTATSITSTSATITWTTDQASSSKVNYGLTSGYGSTSTLDTSLVTSHSVTLTGLTTSSTYNYAVISANSTGTSTTSLNFTFTTPSTSATPPQVGYVAYWGVNNSGVTISWSTDILANTQLAYGTTTALGQLTPLQTTLSASHGVVLTGLNSGTKYYFVAQGTAANGATGYSAVYTFTTTGTASNPAPVITNVTALSITNTSATITWTTDQASSSQVNYGTTTSYGSASTLNSSLVTNHSVTLNGLTAGTTYNFDVVSANSGAASTTSSNATFTTTGTAPAPLITSVTATGISNTSATITWTTDQASTSAVTYGATPSYGSTSGVNNSLVTSHSVTLTGLTANTTYNFAVVSANAGGISTTSPNATFTTTATVVVAPVITSVTATSITSTSATITWTTDQASSSKVNYGLTSGYGSTSTLDTSLVTSHSVTLTGLTAGSTYNYDVVSANSAGTATTSSNSTFTTPSASATPPQVGYVAYWGVNNSGVTISWSTDILANTQLAYGTTTALGQLTPLQTTLSASHGVVLTGLNSGTKYYFVAQGTAANGATGYSAVYTFTTTGTASNPAPVITNVTALSITNTSATITWTTDQASSSQVNYGTTTSYGSASTLNSSLATNHSVTLTGLTAGTTYNFDVVSANSAAASTTSSNATFTTTGTAPAPLITSVTATNISSTSATITWTTDQASTSAVTYGATSGYGSASATNTSLVTSHSVTLTGLTARTIYNFAVVSANASGTSANSSNSTFATTAVAGPPAISSVTATSITNTSATITWTTDQASSSAVTYGTTSSYGSTSGTNTSLVTTHSVTLTGLAAGTTYNFAVVSANSAGVSSTSSNYTFATPSSTATPPNVSYVAYWGISASGIYISWSTDVSANTVLAYGTTNALGQFTPVQSTLSTSHGVVLTGLNASTTYYFQAQATAANGATGYSTIYSFTTLSSGLPTISNVNVVTGSGNTATISWTTSVPTMSYVQYGTTASYNRYSSQTQLTNTPSPALGYVPSGTVHYQLVSTDASGNQVVSPDYTFTEP